MSEGMTVKKRSWLSAPYAVWVVGFTIIPMIVIFQYALTDKNGRLTLANIGALVDPIHLKALVFSLEIAAGCTAICILLAYPLVLALNRLILIRQ